MHGTVHSMHVNSKQSTARGQMATLAKGKGEAAGEALKWNPGSETDPMVVIASSTEVRCGGGTQKGAQGNSSAGELRVS